MDAPADARDRPTSPRTLYPIVELKAEGSGSVVTIGAGTRLGVSKDRKAYLVQKDGTRVPRGELTITSVGEHTTWATSTRSPYELRDPGLQAYLAP